jgi:hypothetical protein
MDFQQKLFRFLRKPPRAKWLAVRAKLREFVNPTHALILHRLDEIHNLVRHSSYLGMEQWRKHEFTRERYADGKRLEPYGFKVYSQNDEDGMIQEIFRRIGTQSRMFVEFGVENGLENNTLKLVLEGWRGLWIEADAKFVAAIKSRFSHVLADNRLAVREAFITAENINELIGVWHEREIDLLSIDIDGNDFYIWRAINVITPRVVVIECNSKFPPPISIVQEYNPNHVSRGTDYFGASLEALTRLGARLGYSLVGTNLQAANAFFVRNDLVDEKFQAPFSAENHYNNKMFLWPYYAGSGHRPDWGRWVQVD